MNLKLTLMGKVIVVLLALAALGMYSVGWESALPQLAVAVIVVLGIDAFVYYVQYNHYRPKLSEEAVITGLIIGMVLSPSADAVVILLAGIAAAVSKFVIAEGRRNIFNPAAFGLLVAAALMHPLFGWWGSMGAGVFVMGVPVLMVALGLYVTWQAHRFDTVLPFIATFAVLSTTYSSWVGAGLFSFVLGINWFFAFIMVSEPITSPLTKKNRYIYGALVGVLAAVSTILIPLYAEIGALVLANSLVPTMNRYIK